MSLLARSLLALACAALLHASSADDYDILCDTLDMGLQNDTNTRKVTLTPFFVKPDSLIYVPDVLKPDEALVGQHLMACTLGRKVFLNPVTPEKHSPVAVRCKSGCREGVTAYVDQYVIKTV